MTQSTSVKRLSLLEVTVLYQKYSGLLPDETWRNLFYSARVGHRGSLKMTYHDYTVRILHKLILAKRIKLHISNLNHEHERSECVIAKQSLKG